MIKPLILGIVENWETNAILNKDGEIFNFHHWGPEKPKEERERSQLFHHLFTSVSVICFDYFQNTLGSIVTTRLTS